MTVEGRMLPRVSSRMQVSIKWNGAQPLPAPAGESKNKQSAMESTHLFLKALALQGPFTFAMPLISAFGMDSYSMGKFLTQV